MKIFVSFFIYCLTSNLLFSQEQKIPNWYLSYLFESLDEADGQQPLGLPLLWDSKTSRSFLNEKLGSDDIAEKIRAISLIGVSRDTFFVNQLNNLIEDENYMVAEAAITAVGQLRDQTSVRLLEKMIEDEIFSEFTIRSIIESLKFICRPSSLKVLNEFVDKMQVTSEAEKRIKEKCINTIGLIVLFNQDENSKRQLLISALKNNDLFGWSINQQYYINDKSYLPYLREFQSTIKKEKEHVFIRWKYKYECVLKLRLWLSDNQLTPEEEIYVAKNPQIWPLEKRDELIRQEIEFLEKNGYGKD